MVWFSNYNTYIMESRSAYVLMTERLLSLCNLNQIVTFILLICTLTSVFCLDSSLLFFECKILSPGVDSIILSLKDLFFESWRVGSYPNFSLCTLPFVLSKTNVTQTKFRNMTDSEFKHWFVGFSDAEGCFRIAVNNSNKVISFNFAILLHIDDKEVLEFIKNKLNCGNVYTSENTANYVVTKISEIRNILIPIYAP